MYKKISTIETKDDIYEIQDELYDRFGDIPLEVFNLINISHMKAMIEDMGISEMIEKNNMIEFKYQDQQAIDLEVMSQVLNEYKRKLKIKHDEPRFLYRFRNKSIDDQQKVTEILKFVKRVYKLYKE
jgi:transcription-repair coupling factor (superfamily II helicase)